MISLDSSRQEFYITGEIRSSGAMAVVVVSASKHLWGNGNSKLYPIVYFTIFFFVTSFGEQGCPEEIIPLFDRFHKYGIILSIEQELS